MYSEKQIQYGFWYWDTENEFPPPSIERPEEYRGESRVNIACTQRLDLTSSEQKQLVASWVDFLPSCKNIEMLWFTTHTHQHMFDAVCKMDQLVGLNIKWSNIKRLDGIVSLKNLRFLRIGSSAQVESINPLTELSQLEVLSVENLKRISDFSPFVVLKNLKFLSIEGGMYTKQKVDSFVPIAQLEKLIHLSLIMVSCRDRSIEFALGLKNLQSLRWGFSVTVDEIARLQSELPNLKHLPHQITGGYQNKAS